MSAPVRRLIVNADDLGYDPAVNEGIVRAMRSGVVTSSTLMVNLPHSAHGATLARGLPVGLHLNLSRGAPLSSRFPPSFLRDGAFELRDSDGDTITARRRLLAQLTLKDGRVWYECPAD